MLADNGRSPENAEKRRAERGMQATAGLLDPDGPAAPTANRKKAHLQRNAVQRGREMP